VDSRITLHQAILGLIRSVFPPTKGVRPVGVTLSNFAARRDRLGPDASLPPESDDAA